jgi:hypothetical protein
VINAAPTTTAAGASQQFGYFTYIRGLAPTSQAGIQDEHSALFTFFSSGTITGLARGNVYNLIDVQGTTTIYLVTGRGGDFSDPDSFRSGAPVLTASFSQHVVLNTSDRNFSTVFLNKVTAVTPFALGAACFQLGRVGQLFQQVNAGQQDARNPLLGSYSGAALGAGGAPLKAVLTGGAFNMGAATGSGSATVFLSPSLGIVCFDLSVSGIVLPATASHIHKGAAGVAGPVVVPFAPLPNGSASGCTFGVDPGLINDILANPANYYVNVHNAPYPAGAIRGQLTM